MDKQKILKKPQEKDWEDFRRAVRLTREIFSQRAFEPFLKTEIQPGSAIQSNKEIDRFITNVFYPATSLGGVESLIEHRATVSGPDFPVHPNLLRLSIGIEETSDLIDDLEQALEREVFEEVGVKVKNIAFGP